MRTLKGLQKRGNLENELEIRAKRNLIGGVQFKVNGQLVFPIYKGNADTPEIKAMNSYLGQYFERVDMIMISQYKMERALEVSSTIVGNVLTIDMLMEKAREMTLAAGVSERPVL